MEIIRNLFKKMLAIKTNSRAFKKPRLFLIKYLNNLTLLFIVLKYKYS